jgi:hypothetical protein
MKNEEKWNFHFFKKIPIKRRTKNIYYYFRHFFHFLLKKKKEAKVRSLSFLFDK